jgi:sugar phosphate permease
MMPDTSETEPEQRRKGKFYYGWTIITVLFLVEFIAYSTTGSTITLFFPKMSESLGFSLTQLTGAVTAAGFAGMVAAPITGPLLDRYGPRWVLAFGAVASGIALVLMTQVQEIWQYWILFGFIGAMGMGEMGRLSTSVVVSKWFIRRRGRALAFAASGNPLGGMLLSPVVGALILAFGWRSTWGILAVALLAITLPLVLIFMRRQPEDMGLLPDGDLPTDDMRAASPTTDLPRTGPRFDGLETTWTVKEAMQTRTLWLMVVASNLVGFATAGVSWNQVAFFVNEGMSIQGAAFVLSASAMGTASARWVWGFIVERYSIHACLSTMAGIRALGTLSLVVVPYPFNIPTFVLGWGTFGGAFGLVQPIAWSNYYGRRFQGSIQGTMRPFMQISRLIAPFTIAAIFDATGSYDTAFLIAFAIAASSTVLFWAAKPPVPWGEPSNTPG